jgi:small conductance mechanosensitive channel
MEHLKPPEVAKASDIGTQDALDDNAGVAKNKKKWNSKFRFVENFFSSLLMIFLTDPDTLRIAAKICSWTTWTFFALSTFGTIGFDTKPFLSLLSVFGLTIGFAAKDILTNIFKGFYVLFTRPFKRGWIISVNGFRGKITSIDGRYVTLHSLIDKSEVLVPLSMIYDTAIVVERKLDA